MHFASSFAHPNLRLWLGQTSPLHAHKDTLHPGYCFKYYHYHHKAVSWNDHHFCRWYDTLATLTAKIRSYKSNGSVPHFQSPSCISQLIKIICTANTNVRSNGKCPSVLGIVPKRVQKPYVSNDSWQHSFLISEHLKSPCRIKWLLTT